MCRYIENVFSCRSQSRFIVFGNLVGCCSGLAVGCPPSSLAGRNQLHRLVFAKVLARLIFFIEISEALSAQFLCTIYYYMALKNPAF